MNFLTEDFERVNNSSGLLKLSLSESSKKTLVIDQSLNLDLELNNGAELNIIEIYKGQGAQQAKHSIKLAEGGRLNYALLQLCENDSEVDYELNCEQKDKSEFNFDSFAFGAKAFKKSINVHLNGERSQCDLKGLFCADSDRKVEEKILVKHSVPNCQSSQLYRGLFQEKGQGVFDGKILVEHGASGSLAFQNNRNLVLDKTAKIETRPQLEIYTDDVQCAHGATTGQIDENALFFLRARGFPKGEAHKLLVRAFAREVIQNFKYDECRELIQKAIFKD